jgi:hypothetical protein
MAMMDMARRLLDGVSFMALSWGKNQVIVTIITRKGTPVFALDQIPVML